MKIGKYSFQARRGIVSEEYINISLLLGHNILLDLEDLLADTRPKRINKSKWRKDQSEATAPSAMTLKTVQTTQPIELKEPSVQTSKKEQATKPAELKESPLQTGAHEQQEEHPRNVNRLQFVNMVRVNSRTRRYCLGSQTH